MPELVHVERSGAHATVVIDHPKANAISSAVIAELSAAFTDLAADGSVRAVVLTGAGERFFAAGADVTEFPAAATEGRAGRGGGELASQIETLPKPVIAAVNGMALGGGCELAMACDVRIAARSARFGQPEINLGIIPGWGGTQRLPRLIGRGRAMTLLLTGDPIDADTALAWGLVTAVVEDTVLQHEAAQLAERIAAKAPLAIAATKRAVHRGADRSLSEALAGEAEEFSALFATEDAREGVTAYLEKRTPHWSGR